MGKVIDFKTAEELDRDSLKNQVSEAIDKTDYFIGLAYDYENDKLTIYTGFDATKYKVFCKGLLQHASDCLHDHTSW